MKKIILSVLTLLAFTGSGTAQTLPSYVPANGLVGWWPFNGNANDESGNGRNGIINGGVITSIDRFGQNNSSYEFNGNDGFIEISNSTEMNYPDGYSLSGWINFTQNQPDNNVFSKHSTNIQNGFILGVVDNKARFYSNSINMLSAEAINNGNWHHIVATFNGSTMKLYLDNQMQDTINQPYLPNGFKVNIGKANGCCYFSGKIDDIAIYNRALSQQEITALYQGANTTANCLDLPSNLQQGLVGYWPFCGNALDESGNNNHGTVNGATLTADRFGNQGSAYGFDGTNDGILINNSNTSGDFSFSSWMNPNEINGRHTISSTLINTQNFPNGWELVLDSTASGDSLVLGNGSIGKYAKLVEKNKWVNSTLVYYSNEQTMKLYVNGILIQEQPNFILNNQSSKIGIGFRSNYPNTPNNFFSGTLDDIAIWNRALSQNEITQLYNQGICQTSITVTDTLLIHTGITSYYPLAYQNTVKVWPNPGNQDITLDAGNLSLMQGWKIKISNSLGQEVYPAALISQQQQVLDMSAWGGNGLYLLHLINPQGHITEVKKIVLAP